MADDFYPGKRLCYDDQLCTVRYVGKIQGMKGEWLGVEWDDPERGKHDGKHNGVRYFECTSRMPAAASFIRPSRPAGKSRSFEEALRHKYASEVALLSDPVQSSQQNSIDSSQMIRISGKEVEEVGFDKIRRQLADLRELRIVILDSMRLSRPISPSIRNFLVAPPDVHQSHPNELLHDAQTNCPKITELDLSRNLLEQWIEVLSIYCQLDHLHSLRVDGNRFRDISLSRYESRLATTISGLLRSLSLNDTLLDWAQISTIATCFPNLASLSASNNRLHCLSDSVLPATLTTLTLEYNEFRSLDVLVPLRQLPHLERLSVKHNSIASVTNTTRVSESRTDLIFPESLYDIDLSYNNVESWGFINDLHVVFPGMTSLRIAHNPLYQSLSSADGKKLTVDDGYMLTLARLARLQALNYSSISAKERLNAESYYLSQIAKELAAVSESSEISVVAQHPRFHELCEEYGQPVVARSTSALNPNSLAARLIKIELRLTDNVRQRMLLENAPSTLKIEVPQSLTAYSIMGIIGRRLGLQPLMLGLVWETGEWLLATKDSNTEVGEWDSEEEDQEVGQRKVAREVDIIAGTRMIGTWLEGVSEAILRVDVKS